MRCHACESQYDVTPGEPLGFRANCEACQADLHVCLSCEHHDPQAYNECREPNAERVLDKDRGNRCEYFRSGTGEAAGTSDRDRSLSDLDNLFKKG